MPDLAGAAYDVYLTPIKTAATADSLAGWGMFNVKKDGKALYGYSLCDTSCTYASMAFAPYFVGHFEMNGTTPVKHIVNAHGEDYYLAAPVQTNSGWSVSGSNSSVPGSVDFRGVAGLDAASDCGYYHNVIRDSAMNFIDQIGTEYSNKKLVDSTTVSLIPFAGVVDTQYMTSLQSLDTEGLMEKLKGTSQDKYKWYSTDFICFTHISINI